MENQGMFNTWDYIVFFATVVISFSIGVFFAVWDRKRDTPLNYFLAGKNSGILPVTFSFIVTFQSSLMIIGTPAEVYIYGMKLMFVLIGILIAFIVGGLILVPVFHPLQITSVYKYFQLRYHNNEVRYLALIMGVTFNSFYMGSVTVGTCIALEVVMGVPFWATIILYTTITTIYTSIGGIKAVIWSDVFQLIMMMTGIIALLIKSIADSGGLPEVLKLAADRIDVNDFRLDPRIRYQFWNASFGPFSSFFFITCTQAGIQRIKSTPTVKSARTIYLIAAPLYCLFYLLAAFQGVTLFAYYSSKGCDPMESGRIDNYNELVPIAVLDLFHSMPGLAGLFVASLSSAALSTLSSCLSSVSAITYDDVILEKYPNISDRKATFLSKIVVLVYGVIGLILAFAILQLGGTLSAIFTAFTGCIDGPASAIFLLSILSKRITSKGVFIGSVCGMAVTFWLNIGRMLTTLPPSDKLTPGPTDQCLPEHISLPSNNSFTSATNAYNVSNTESLLSITEATAAADIELSSVENIYSISFVLYSLIGFLTTVIVAIIVSFFTEPPEKIDERCMFSFKRHILQKGTEKQNGALHADSVDREESNELMSKKL